MNHLKEPTHGRVETYRRFLYTMLTFGVIAVMLSIYYFMWLSIPSTIMIKAGVDQELDFKVPAKGELYKEAVEVSGGPNAGTENSSILRSKQIRSININSSLRFSVSYL